MDKKKLIKLHKLMIAQGKIPTMLYKHTSISDNLKNSLKNAQLWFAAPTTFNDPFDCQINDQTKWTDDVIEEYVNYTTRLTKEKINPSDVVQANKNNPGSFNQHFTKTFKNVLSKIGVTCFLPTPDNLLLWAHYSASHTGVCLKFDITEDPDFFSTTFSVKYSKDYPVFDYLKEKNNLVNKAVLTKSYHWAYEKEIRTLQTSFGLHDFNKECLKEIIFGCKTDRSEITEIKKIISDAGYPDLKFKQVKLREKQYEIDIVET
jgi:DUF2971 family protein